MTTTRTKDWDEGDILTAADLEAQLDNIITGLNALESKLPTGTDYQMFDETVADDGSFTLEAATNHGCGEIVANNGAVFAKFTVDNDGDCYLIYNTGNVVVNADTDGYLCIGTAAAQEPLTIKNRLGSSVQVTVLFWHN